MLRISRRVLLGAPLAAPALAPPAMAQGAAELRVGAIFPAASLLGDEALRGLELAVEERGTQRPTRLLRGEAADPAQAVAEARRLIQAERCVLLFGSASAAMALAAGQAAEALDVPYVELCSAAEALVERGARLFVRAGPRAADYGAAAAAALTRFLPGQLNQPAEALRLAILHEASPSAESIGQACETRLREAGVIVVERLAHAARVPEMPALVQRMRAAGVVVLMHVAAEGDAAALLRALDDAAWRPGAVLGVGSAWALAEAPGLEGCFALDVPPISSADAWATGARPFAEAYHRRWGSRPRSGLSLAAFAAARPILAAPQRAALAALDLPEGELANGWGFRLDERGQNTRAAPVLMQWRQGRPVAVWPEVAAFSPP
jgi:branched-chain amino acid transport system substrate-binding protein